MNYELVKQLKEAGFPQTPPFELYCPDCDKWRDMDCFEKKHNKEAVKVPTLSELIEACGDKFDNLRHGEGLIVGSLVWTASSKEIEKEIFHNEGSTPEEAVAKLWLELNK